MVLFNLLGKPSAIRSISSLIKRDCKLSIKLLVGMVDKGKAKVFEVSEIAIPVRFNPKSMEIIFPILQRYISFLKSGHDE